MLSVEVYNQNVNVLFAAVFPEPLLAGLDLRPQVPLRSTRGYTQHRLCEAFLPWWVWR